VLPDFALTVVVDGVPRRFAACDVPAFVFFLEHPDDHLGTPCYLKGTPEYQQGIREQQETWATRLLTRVILAPALTPETVHRLGRGREDLGIAYQTAIGLAPDPPRDLPPAEILPAPWPGPRPWEREILRARTWVPGPNFRERIRLVAARTRRPHLEVWAMPISEWVLTWRIAVEDDQRRRQGPGPAAAPAPSVSSLVNLVGREIEEAA
jgi:hypothetical protein